MAVVVGQPGYSGDNRLIVCCSSLMGWRGWLMSGLGFGMGVWAAWLMQQSHPFDFMTFWTSARHLSSPYARQWIAPYERAWHGIALPFAYPPTFLLIVYPFSLLPVKLAGCLWSGLCFSLAGAAAHLYARAAAPVILLSLPLLYCAALGQTGLLVGALMLLGMYFVPQRPKLAGVLLAVAACVKPQAMLAAPIVLWGRWDVIRAATVAGFAIMTASLLFGPERWVEWFQALASFGRWFHKLRLVAPMGLYESWLWKALWVAIGVILALRRDALGLVAGSLAMSPYAQLYDLCALAILGLSWVNRWREGGLLPALVGAVILWTPTLRPEITIGILFCILAMQWRWIPKVNTSALALA